MPMKEETQSGPSTRTKFSFSYSYIFLSLRWYLSIWWVGAWCLVAEKTAAFYILTSGILLHFFPSFIFAVLGGYLFSLVRAFERCPGLVSWCFGVVAFGCCLHGFNEEHLYEDGQIKSPLVWGHVRARGFEEEDR